MMTRQIAVLLLFTVLVAAGVFHLKYSVVRLGAELARLDADIEETRWEIATLEADWAYLTRPERLGRQASVLDMVPASAGRIVDIEQIGRMRQLELSRDSIPFVLPSGGEAAFLAKPIYRFRLDHEGGPQ